MADINPLVLGAAMCGPDAAVHVTMLCKPEDFQPVYRAVFIAIAVRSMSHESCDPVVLWDEEGLSDNDGIVALGGLDHLVNLAGAALDLDMNEVDDLVGGRPIKRLMN